MNRWKQAVAWYEGLASRERIMVTFGGGALLLTLIFVGVYEPLIDGRRALEKKVAARERELGEIAQIADRVFDLRQKLAAFNARLVGGAAVSPLSELEDLTTAMGMEENVSSMSPGQRLTIGGYEEQIITLQLKKVTLGKVTGLLKELAKSKNGLRVKRLEIKPEFEDPSLLTVSLSVAAYKPA